MLDWSPQVYVEHIQVAARGIRPSICIRPTLSPFCTPASNALDSRRSVWMVGYPKHNAENHRQSLLAANQVRFCCSFVGVIFKFRSGRHQSRSMPKFRRNPEPVAGRLFTPESAAYFSIPFELIHYVFPIVKYKPRPFHRVTICWIASAYCRSVAHSDEIICTT